MAELVAAVPFALLDLPGRTDEADAAVLAAAAGLEAEAAASVQAHVDRARRLVDGAATTGFAFLLAGGAAGAIALSLYGTGCFGDMDPTAAAALLAAALGLDAAPGGRVERPTTDPAVVAALAAVVGPAALASLARTHPHLIGPVDGMPIELRYAANRVLALAAADAFDAIGARGRAAAVRALAAPDRQLLYVDPVRGHAAEVLGDLRSATAVSVVVPGMGNTIGEFATVRAKAAALRSTAAELDPAEELVTIAWLGYASPGVAGMVLDDDARNGGTQLVRFVEGLTAGGAPAGATLTVVGHSYGSVVAGEALRHGLDVDAVAVTGSPGMGVERADDLGSTPIYAMAARWDLIALIEHFGADPADPDFGATRLDTGNALFHDAYYRDGSLALRNIAYVATGRAAEAAVVRPGIIGEIIDALEDQHERAGRPIDAAQNVVRAGAGVVSEGVDWLEDVVPEPAAGVLDDAQDVAGAALELGNGAVDLGQRVTSPGFWGVVLEDAWNLGG